MNLCDGSWIMTSLRWKRCRGFTVVECWMRLAGQSGLILDLLEADGLIDLVVVVRVVLPGGQLQERFRDQLALAIPGTSHSLIQLEDGISHVHVRGHAFCLRFTLIIVDRAWQLDRNRKLTDDTISLNKSIVQRSEITLQVFWRWWWGDVPESIPSSSLSNCRAMVIAERRSVWADLLFLTGTYSRRV